MEPNLEWKMKNYVKTLKDRIKFENEPFYEDYRMYKYHSDINISTTAEFDDTLWSNI